MIRLKSSRVSQQAADLPDHDAAGLLVLQVAQDLGHAEHAHGDRHEVEPVGQLGHVEGEARVPVSTSLPTRPSSRPSTIIANALSSEPRASATDATRPSTISEKYSAGPNFSATSASGGAAQRQQQGGDRAGEEGAERGGRQRRAGAALAGHLVAVDRGDHREDFRRAG